MKSITHFIEKKLKLVINQEKNKVALSKYVKFLGMTVIAGTLAISLGSMNRGMEKVKELTPRGTHYPIEKTIEEINKWYTGWSSYYGMTQYPSQLKKIEAHIRRRLRSRIIGQQKKKRYLVKKLVKYGVRKSTAEKTVYTNNKRWALSHKMVVSMAFSNYWFIETMGLKIASNKKLPYWFSVNRWIKMT